MGCIFIDHRCAARFDSFIPAIIAAGQHGHLFILASSDPAIHYGFSICDVGLDILSYSHVLLYYRPLHAIDFHTPLRSRKNSMHPLRKKGKTIILL